MGGLNVSYRFGIPSYKRKDCLHTLRTLVELGYGKSEIIISTQTEADYMDYKKAFGAQATIIYNSAANDSQNRNTCIDYFDEGEEFLLLDDDIKAFCRLEEIGEKKLLSRFQTRTQLDKTFEQMFSYCQKHNSPMWAWYPIPNAFFMSNSIDQKNIFVGTILGVKNSRSRRFDETFDLKGDYEISLRLMLMGYNAVRFNGFTVEANHRSKGGCEDARNAGHNAKRCAALLERYPTLIKPGRKKGEIRYIGKTK